MDSLIALLAENDEEVLIFDQILNSRDRKYHYLKKRPGVFRLDELDDNYCFVHFRFYKNDIRRLRVLLRIPDDIVLTTRVRVSGEEAFCILLKRLAYPSRYADLMQFFPRGKSALSAIFNAMVKHIICAKGHLLENLNQPWLSPDNVKRYCCSIYKKGSPYDRCFGFLDGTVKATCRPVYNQRQFYNGHKRLHSLKYQALMLPNGIIANWFGPKQGRRHDSFVLAKSQLLNKLQQKFQRFSYPPYIYSDTGYPLKKYLMVPFKGAITRRQNILNKKMSKLRVAVEWGFSKIVQIFPFLDYKKNLKIYKQHVGSYFKVGVILSNCHTCLYNSQVSSYFDCDPPSLEEYLG